MHRFDGEYCDMLARGVPVIDGDGKTLEWVGVHADITDRKQNEKALTESERFSRSTLDALSAHIAIIDETGLILATNRAWREFSVANCARTEVGVGANYLDACDRAIDSIRRMQLATAFFVIGVSASRTGGRQRSDTVGPPPTVTMPDSFSAVLVVGSVTLGAHE